MIIWLGTNAGMFLQLHNMNVWWQWSEVTNEICIAFSTVVSTNSNIITTPNVWPSPYSSAPFASAAHSQNVGSYIIYNRFIQLKRERKNFHALKNCKLTPEKVSSLSVGHETEIESGKSSTWLSVLIKLNWSLTYFWTVNCIPTNQTCGSK